jgi:glycosyltransferase involved in cell wall biosynthesis
MNDDITILIPTYNRAQALKAVWPSYMRCGDVKRIVVVNDGSTDQTSALVRALKKDSPIPVTLIENPERLGQQLSRKKAIASADTKWVLFGEDDVYLDDCYINTLHRQAYELSIYIIAGRLVTVIVPGEFSPDLIQDVPSQNSTIFDLTRLDADFSASPPTLMTAPYLHSIALIKRAIFTNISFDPWYKGNAHREETDFYISANESGYRVYFTPDTVCFHLRGPICKSGGQRINRLALEFWYFINTWHMVSKHWHFLQKQYQFSGIPITWMMSYFVRRQIAQLKRVLHGNFRSTFHGSS